MIRFVPTRWNPQQKLLSFFWFCACASLGEVVLAQDARDVSNGPSVLLAVSFDDGTPVRPGITYISASDILRESLRATLSRAGFEIKEHSGMFDEVALRNVDVTVIAGALIPENVIRHEDSSRTFPVVSAFSRSEIAALRNWVEVGGSLMVIADHPPYVGGIIELADAFGARFVNGWVEDTSRLPRQEGVLPAGNIVFTRENGIQAHAITDGLGDGEHVQIVLSATGSAFQLPEGAESILTLGPTYASDSRDNSPVEPVDGWSQFGVIHFGRGRVALAAEFGFAKSEEEIRPDLDFLTTRVGVSLPFSAAEVDNHRLFVNTLHWLAGED